MCYADKFYHFSYMCITKESMWLKVELHIYVSIKECQKHLLRDVSFVYPHFCGQKLFLEQALLIVCRNLLSPRPDPCHRVHVCRVKPGPARNSPSSRLSPLSNQQPPHSSPPHSSSSNTPHFTRLGNLQTSSTGRVSLPNKGRFAYSDYDTNLPFISLSLSPSLLVCVCDCV